MLAMPGLRAFALAATPGSEGVSFDAHGVFAGGVALLQPPSAKNPYWTARPAAAINKELTARYRLPIDIASKAGALALIAAALNRGDLAMAAIATVQMQLPDPPPLAKSVESANEIRRRAQELIRSGLVKFWDPAKHPRAGVPPNPGWFAPTDDDAEPVEDIPRAAPTSSSWLTLVSDKPERHEPIPNVEMGNPADKPWEPPPAEGEGGENAPRGILELPLLGGGSSGASLPRAAPRPSAPLPVQPSLPFPGGLPPQLAPYVPGGKTSGALYMPGRSPIPLQSGYGGPTQDMPPGSSGFNLITKAHVEGQAAAIMQQQGISVGTLFINNPKVFSVCDSLLPRMLPRGAILNVVLPNGTVVQYKGIIR